MPYAEDLDGDRIHVKAPTAIIFLCGGPCSDIGHPTPRSLRDAFLKIIDNPALRSREILRAEDISVLSILLPHYQDLLQFETDLAQITDMILLFSESEGSLAELGAFSMVEEIASRLLVVIRDKHWADDSFVKLGPLRALQTRYGIESVFVIDDKDVDIRGRAYDYVKKDILRDRLQDIITFHLNKNRDPSTFDQTRTGHIIKLIVGLVQEYGALTIPEIEELLFELNINKSQNEIAAYLLCAQATKWVVEMRKGATLYYFARNLPDAATIPVKATASVKNRERRRFLIREHWGKTDIPRDIGIKQVFGLIAP